MEKKTISLIAAGDICMNRAREEMDAEYSKRILEKVQPILDDADFRLVNLENPLTVADDPIPKSGPNLKGLEKNVAFLQVGKFDCAVQANNHTGDFGEAGVLETLEILDKNKIGRCGAGKNIDEAYLPWIAEKDGLKIAVLSVCENEFGCAEWNKAGSAGFEIGRVYNAIQDAKKKADFVVVVFHGGNEHNPLPSPRMKERYRLFVDFGADAVVGMHPHCPQGYETYKGAPIVYSVGNFFFYAYTDDLLDTWFYGYLPKLTFAKGEPAKLDIFPYCFRGGHAPVEPFEGEKKQIFMDYLKEITDLFADDRVHEEYFEGWCMITGVSYAGGLQYESRYLENPELWKSEQRLRSLRNLYTCEAHNELMIGVLRTIERNRVEKAKETAEKIKKLQRMPEALLK